MHIALLADIHGNLAAFEAVLAEISRVQPDETICLGDVADTGPQPKEVLDRLRRLRCPVVMGNADASLLDPRSGNTSPDQQLQRFADITRWCAAQLDEADRAFIRSFQPTTEVNRGSAGRLLCCHGSPRSYDDIIVASTSEEEIDAMLGSAEAGDIATGHTHIRMLRSAHGREIVNPGSVGLAYQFLPDGGVRVPPWAEYAVLTVENAGAASIDFRRVPYDRDATVKAMFEREMPHAEWWSSGWH